ncbi:MAG: thioesterase family protein [Actinobacteria bacterium]|nr:thioesterase family protein [Actinomycetota bacterium]
MELLGLTPVVDGHTSFELTEPLVRFDAKLFGGTGLAVVVEAMEVATGRDALWATVQFVGSADEGERIDVHVEELARGGTTSQARVTGTVDGRIVFAGLGSSARHRDGGFGAAFSAMPVVAPPEDCRPLTFGGFEPPPEARRKGPFSIGEYRIATDEGGAHRVWVHLDGIGFSRAALGYVADFVPTSVLRAAGRLGGGTSLDNSMRFGPSAPPDTEWVLFDGDPYFGDNGFVHGAARMWAADGTLVAVASQSAVARVFDGSAIGAQPAAVSKSAT